MMGLLTVISLVIGFQLPAPTVGIIDLTRTKPPETSEPAKASLGQFPWQVLVQTTKPAGVGKIAIATCGASIVDEHWIMSAAHCFVKNKYDADGKPNGSDIVAINIVLYAGIIDKKTKAGSEMQKYEFDEKQIKTEGNDQVMFIHDLYNKEKEDDNDIALFKLKQPLKLSTTGQVQKIKLGTNNDVEANKLLTASGWGKMFKDANEDNPAILRYVEKLRLFLPDKCKMTEIPNFTDKQICQMTIDKGTYDGDSGGPVITGEGLKSEAPYVQIGIVSRDFSQPGNPRIMSVYTDVTKFLVWIKMKMISGTTLATPVEPERPVVIIPDGNTPSFPVGPEQTFLNSLVNPSFGSGGAQPPSPLTPALLLNPNCQDSRFECSRWAQDGECTNNIDYMAPHCKRSCGRCENPDQDCVNNNDYCTAWQIRGQCQSNPDYMRENCKAACKECGRTSLPAGLRRHSGAKPPGILATDACPPGLPSN